MSRLAQRKWGDVAQPKAVTPVQSRELTPWSHRELPGSPDGPHYLSPLPAPSSPVSPHVSFTFCVSDRFRGMMRRWQSPGIPNNVS